jgi:hypothetical protein
MTAHDNIPDTNFNDSPLRKVVHFDESLSIPAQSATSVSLLTSASGTSLSLPLIAEKAGVRFKLFILLLSLFIALIIGFILSLLLVTQLIHVPKRTSLSRRYLSTLSEQNDNRLLDFNVDVCEDFYGVVCRKWLVNHPLSTLDFKRSWLTERSRDIRNKFAEKLTNLSDIQAYNHQIEINKNQTEEPTNEIDFETSAKNE